MPPQPEEGKFSSSLDYSSGIRLYSSLSHVPSLNLIWVLPYMIPYPQNFRIFLPLPPCLHLELIFTIKFTQPPLLCPLFHDPLTPQVRTSYIRIWKLPLAGRRRSVVALSSVDTLHSTCACGAVLLHCSPWLHASFTPLTQLMLIRTLPVKIRTVICRLWLTLTGNLRARAAAY